MRNNKTYIISLGGSLIAPPAGIDPVRNIAHPASLKKFSLTRPARVSNGVDWKFLKKFREVIINEIKNGRRFVIVAGGGWTCRLYQNAASKVVKLTDDDKDWLGVHSTRLNAHLIKTIFRDCAHPRVNKNPMTKADLETHFAKGEKIMVAAGWRPGWSTDYVAVILAERLGAKTIINLSNIDYVYDKDPKKYKNGKKIKNINWKNFRKLVGNKWDPGLNAPFDPVASRKAEEAKLEVMIMNGKKLNNLKNYLEGKDWKGTIINTD